jgi:hypothetical protein
MLEFLDLFGDLDSQLSGRSEDDGLQLSGAQVLVPSEELDKW